MIEVVYASAESTPFSESELEELLFVARRNNAAVGVTGILLYQEGSFLQVLEGPDAAVKTIMARVSRDTRHERVLILRKREVEERSFAEWRMGFVRLGPNELEGFSNFMASGRMADVAERTEALDSILAGFRRGRWRQSVAP
ncbi:MAG: BLUF domain-containing protein [Sandaracinaceae bacterium]